MEPPTGIEPMQHPYQGCRLPLHQGGVRNAKKTTLGSLRTTAQPNFHSALEASLGQASHRSTSSPVLPEAGFEPAPQPSLWPRATTAPFKRFQEREIPLPSHDARWASDISRQKALRGTEADLSGSAMLCLARRQLHNINHFGYLHKASLAIWSGLRESDSRHQLGRLR